MKKSLLVLLITLAGFCARAQVYHVKSDKDLSKYIPFEDRFGYPAFTEGFVHFRNGRSSKARLNYSLLHGEIMFINPARDTLLLADNAHIDHIYIGRDLYYFDPGHGHILLSGNSGGVRLGRKAFLSKMGHEKYASYGQYSSTSAISSYSTFMNERGEYSFLESNDNLILKKREVFFLVDKNNRFFLANRANLLKVFHSKKSLINQFLKENNINLEAEPDWDKTLSFANSL